MSCSFDGCERPVEKANLCAGHRKQKVRGEPLRALKVRTYSNDRVRASDRLERAALSLANAESDEDYQRAKRNHQNAASWYAVGLGTTKSADVARLFREVRKALRKLKAGLK